MTAPTDFEQYGLDRGSLASPDRAAVITVDFEAFVPNSIELWSGVMLRWAERQREHGLKSDFFVSVEDVVRLREATTRGYERFLDAARELHRSGTTFYPHNHCVFDPATGARPTPSGVQKQVPGYDKRASMFYDVVYRNGRDIQDWIPQVVESHNAFLSDLGVGRPQRLVFRPGGWDHGSSAEDITAYLEALSASGVVIESGASSGVYGTASCRVGTPFGSNLFALDGGIAEVAPTWFLDCGAGTVSPQFLGALLRLTRQPLWHARELPGVFVTVLHFDHVFHSGWGPTYKYFSVNDPDTVHARVDHAFKQMLAVNRFLNLRDSSFGDIKLVDGTGHSDADGRGRSVVSL
jgi:hypothetical protein